MASEGDWRSSTATAQELEVSLHTLYRFIDRGELVAYRFGRRVRVRRADLAAFVRGARIEPGTIGYLYDD